MIKNYNHKVDSFDFLSYLMYKFINIIQSSTLTQIRDNLLPELMNGEIKV